MPKNQCQNFHNCGGISIYLNTQKALTHLKIIVYHISLLFPSSRHQGLRNLSEEVFGAVLSVPKEISPHQAKHYKSNESKSKLSLIQ